MSTDSPPVSQLAAFTTGPGPAVDPLIGTVIQDRYRILRKLGEGGMGVVYEGEHVLIKRKVAIKCLHQQFAADAAALGRFLQEAHAATSIGNEHIIDVLDLGRFADGTAYMVLEFLDGRSLTQDLRDSGPLPLGRAVRIASQICDALGAAQAKGVVHRDLKPDNIFLLRQGDNPDFVKVLDFGISKIQGGIDTANAVRTRTGLVMGTLHYMPPEQLRAARDMDHRVDIYALGVILFRALTGMHPFEDDTVPMLAMKIIQSPVPVLREFRADIPPDFDRLLQSMLAKDFRGRPESWAAVKNALAPFSNVAASPALTNLAASPSGQVHTIISGVPVLVGPAFRPDAPSGITTSTAATPPRRGALFAVVGVTAVAVVGVAIALFSASQAPAGRAPAPAPAPTPVIAAPPPTRVPTPPVAAHAPERPAAPVAPVAAPASVHVQIQTQPEEAELYLDGSRIPNPFDGELPHSVVARRLECRLAGHTSIVQDLVLNFPQTVRIRLRRGAGVEDRSARRATGTPTPAPVVLAPAPVAAPVTAPAIVRPAAPQAPVPSSVVAPPPPQGLIQNPF